MDLPSGATVAAYYEHYLAACMARDEAALRFQLAETQLALARVEQQTTVIAAEEQRDIMVRLLGLEGDDYY